MPVMDPNDLDDDERNKKPPRANPPSSPPLQGPPSYANQPGYYTPPDYDDYDAPSTSPLPSPQESVERQVSPLARYLKKDRKEEQREKQRKPGQKRSASELQDLIYTLTGDVEKRSQKALQRKKPGVVSPTPEPVPEQSGDPWQSFFDLGGAKVSPDKYKNRLLKDVDGGQIDLDGLITSDKAPKGSMIPLPARYKHEGRNKNNDLKWFWDKEAVQGALDDALAAEDEFQYDYIMSQVIDKRFKTREQFAFNRSKNKADTIIEAIGEAKDALYNTKEEGGADPDYLQNLMDEDPELSLDPLTFRDDYGITPKMLDREMNRRLAEYPEGSPERNEIRKEYQAYYGRINSLERVKDSYDFSTQRVRNAIKSYVKAYEDKFEGEDVGPAIPERQGPEPRSEEDQEFIDASAGKKRKWLRGKKSKEAYDLYTEKVKSELDVKHLPNVEQMLQMQVKAGILDPQDQEEVFEWIERFKNPLHPDTRAMYMVYAQAQNPEITDEEATDFINVHYNKYVEKWTEDQNNAAENAALDERIADIKDMRDTDLNLHSDSGGLFDLVDDTWSKLNQSGLTMADSPAPEGLSPEEEREWYKEKYSGAFENYAKTGESNKFAGGLAWTMDKLLRFNYAVAGATNSMFELDEDPARNWSEGNVVEKALYTMYQFPFGKNPADVADEIVSDPVGSIKDVAGEGYQQFFRGSNMPGIKEGTEPITFSQVIGNNAENDPNSNLYDWNPYQHVMGFIADVAFDPTTYVGIGMIGKGGKFAARQTGSLARDAVTGVNAASERYARMVFGNDLGDAMSLERLNRRVMPKGNWVSQLHSPGASRIADTAWRAREVLGGAPHKGLDTNAAYRSVDDVTPEESLTEAIRIASVRENQLQNDIAVEGMSDYLNRSDLFDDGTEIPGTADVRVDVLQEKLPGLYDLSVKAETAAKEAGYESPRFKKGEEGASAFQAQKELDELSSRMGHVEMEDPAFARRKAELEGQINKGQYHEVEVARFMDENAEGVPSYIVDKVVGGLAKAAKVSDREVLPWLAKEAMEGAVVGRRMLERADPGFKARMRRDYTALRQAQKVMENAKPGSYAYKRAQKAANTAKASLDNATAAGMLQYLQAMEQRGPLVKNETGELFRSSDKPIYSHPEKAANLTHLKDQVNDRLQGLNEQYITPVQERVTPEGTGTGEKAAERSHEFPWNLEDDYETLDDLMNSIDTSVFKDSESLLKNLKKDINRKLKHMRLDPSGRLEGLPPLEATGLKRRTPVRFLTKGKLDPDKVAKRVSVKTEHPNTRYAKAKVVYDKTGLSDVETAWLRDFTTTLRDTFNDVYVERNLHKKGEVTGAGITKKHKNVFTGKGPRHAIVTGSRNYRKGKNDALQAALDRTGDNLKSLRVGDAKGADAIAREWAEGKNIPFDEYKAHWDELGNSAGPTRNAQMVHEAIKQSEADGVPPVVYAFTDGPLSRDKGTASTVDYARTRGVTVYHFERTPQGMVTHKYLGSEDYKGGAIPVPEKAAAGAPIKASKGFEKSRWAKKHPDGIKSADDLLRRSMEKGNVQDLYDTLFERGAPFNLTDRMLTQVDDVNRRLLDETAQVIDKTKVTAEQPGEALFSKHELNDTAQVIEDKLANNVERVVPPKPITFRGERLPYNLSSARKKVDTYVKEHLDEFPNVQDEVARLLNRNQKMTESTAVYLAADKLVVQPLFKKYAKQWYKYLDDLDHSARVKLFNDIFNGSKAAQGHATSREIGSAVNANARIKDSRVDLDTAGPETLGADVYSQITKDALNASIKKLVKQINTRGEIPGSASGKRIRGQRVMDEQQLAEAGELFYGQQFTKRYRRTVNESARDIIREIKRDYAIKEAELELKKATAATREELALVTDQIAQLKAKLKKQEKEVETSRVEALKAKKIMEKDARANALIQISRYPDEMLTDAQVRELIADRNLDTQHPQNRLQEPAIAAEMSVHKWFQNTSASVGHMLDEFNEGYEKFGGKQLDFFTRPSEQLKTPEGREILAMITGGVPVLVHSNQKRIANRMGQMLTENRKQAFIHVRRSSEYTGPQPEFFQGVKDEINEIVDIFNSRHKKYQFELEGRPGQFSFVTWDDMAHWLPKGFMPDMKKLGDIRKTRDLKANDIFESIPNKDKGAWDPAIFAHHMRLAADQARSVRIQMDAINRTFGVPRMTIFDPKKINASGGERAGKPYGNVISQRSKEIEQLSDLGWQTIDDLKNTHYFHPEAVREVRKIVELMTRIDKRKAFAKTMDSAISSWKGLHTSYSPPYYVRQTAGEVLMAWLGGVWNPMYFKRAAQAMKWLKGQDRDLADLMTQLPMLKGKIPLDTAEGTAHAATIGKSGIKVNMEQAWGLFGNHGLKSTFINEEIKAHGARAGAGALLTDNRMMKKVKKIGNIIHDGGEYIEDYVRFAHFLHALEHAPVGGLEQATRYAAQQVRRYHFDYSDVSNFEKVIVGRVFPFYKWTRFAAPVMLSHMFVTPGKVTAPLKALDASAGVLSGSDVHEDINGHLPDYHGMAPAWVRDLWSYQVGGMPGAEDSYATYLRFATPQMDSLTAIWQPEDASMALLNPAIKSAIEISRNEGLDKDFGQFPIRGGEFNEMYGINDAEALAAYGARQLGPFAKTGADIWRGNQETEDGVSFNEYRSEQGYDPFKQFVSNLSGANLYQAKLQDAPATDTEAEYEPKDTAVGQDGLDNLSAVGRKADPSGRESPTGNGEGDVKDIAELLQGSNFSGSSGYSDFGGSNFYGGYGNSYGGYGGYGGGGSGSSGYSFSRQPWSDELLNLIRSLQSQIDEGEVL